MTSVLHLIATVYLTCVTPSCAGANKLKLFYSQEAFDVETVAACTNLTARRLFSAGNRIAIICRQCGVLESAIAKTLMTNERISIADRPAHIKNERIPSYVIVVRDDFSKLRRILLVGDPVLRSLEYLFLTTSASKEVSAFVEDMWAAHFWNIAFLMFNEPNNGTIIRPNAVKKEIILTSDGYCASDENNIAQVLPFAERSQQICKEKNCRVKVGGVTDITVKFWREEDKLRTVVQANSTAYFAKLMSHFGKRYNLTIEDASRNYHWSDATKSLINGKVDIVTGLLPQSPEPLDGLEVICYYMIRDMVFTAFLHVRTIDNNIFKMLMPFHYVVWLCVICVFLTYMLLLCSLRKLSNVGLIKERILFMQFFAIILSQGIAFPKKFSLRLILLLWMIFSLYLNIIYNSTFTSSLAQVETEVLLRDLQELDHSRHVVGGPAIVKSYLNNSRSPVMQDILKRYIVMTPTQALSGIFTNDTVAVLQQFTVDRVNWENRANRSLRVYTLPSPVIRFPVFFFAKKGYPFRDTLRRLVRDYQELGLLKKWTMAYKIYENKQIVLRQSADEILTMKHLLSIFQLFFMCQGISCIVLLIELLQAYVSKA